MNFVHTQYVLYDVDYGQYLLTCTDIYKYDLVHTLYIIGNIDCTDRVCTQYVRV
jgi:hypothetical protein